MNTGLLIALILVGLAFAAWNGYLLARASKYKNEWMLAMSLEETKRWKILTSGEIDLPLLIAELEKLIANAKLQHKNLYILSSLEKTELGIRASIYGGNIHRNYAWKLEEALAKAKRSASEPPSKPPA